MNGVEAAGDLITGALIGRAVEPRAGEGHDAAAHGLCLNCGTGLIGAHCHRCGQSSHIHRSISAIWHEILHGVAHFDGKLWTTLPLLAWRPGELTRRYIHGERARFVSPMALFLFSVFTMFAVFQIVGLSPPSDLDMGSPGARAGIDTARKAMERDRREAIADRAELTPGDAEIKKYDAKIAELDQQLAAVRNIGKGMDIPAQIDEVHTGWERLDHGIQKWKKNPGLMLYKLQSNSYKFSWLLIPLSIPFLWLMFFWKRQYKFYDHAVFVTYSIAAMSILFIVITVLSAFGVATNYLLFIGALLPVWHIYRQLKGAYQSRRITAVLRTMVLLSFITWAIVPLFAIILVLLGTIS